VGALETKKLSVFSGWTLEGCEVSDEIDSCLDQQLENSLPSQGDLRARAKAKQTEVHSRAAGPVGRLNEAMKKELISFLAKQGDTSDIAGAPQQLAALLAEGRVI
jgi:hypothetical protein